MNRHLSQKAITVTAVALMVALPAAASADSDDRAEAASIARVANLITPERAEEIALREKPGAVTDLELDREWGTWVYEIEIVDASGTEWELELDAGTGKVEKVSREWF